MAFGIFDFLSLIGALGLFIFGMKVMSDSIQKVAGNKLREILEAMTSNRLLGVLTGVLITTMVQSSSATTVMVVSFVNAGLLSLIQSIGVIMGANVGTTVTGWLISQLGLGKFSIASMCLPIIAIGFPMMFSSREKLKLWGEVLLGFAILFLGLNFMKEAVGGLQNEELLSFVKNVDYAGQPYIKQFFIVLLFVAIGTVLTIVVQSSSAAMALTLVMCNEGWISFPLAAAIILGENIGTTITANLAALIGNVHAKRAARAHFVFNVFGVLWMLAVFPFFVNLIAGASVDIFGADPMKTATGIPAALALFHTSFNILNLLILVGFVGFIAKVVIKMVPSRSEDDEVFSLDYIGSGMMETPELSILEARKEVVKFADIVRRAFKYVPRLVTEMDEKKLRYYTDQLEKYEDITDRMELEISSYLSKAAKGELSSNGGHQVRSMLNIANYLERIGDIYLEISRNLTMRKKKKAYFTQEMRDRVAEIAALVKKSLDLMVENLEAYERDIDFAKAEELENEIDETYKRLRKEYIKKVESGKFQVRSGVYYSDLISELERIGDHVLGVTESLKKDNELIVEE
ncbi:Na/Pi cotransporter family protein [Owenweeksia hongkongensis]|uniref:Na/Pi-cotransporter n=1 Tax=Owenweeksia hongkongensis (strain DSM 17368 / CIP 108786 / JCM 12287 / NRRL B-23963 / UST20020801) TaxID=926562 RepID=G8R2W9_OWEHD|nr:Na/Pi cotransporter family protein [Owenweeksia hongkongensis]AEV32963.1 Na/Pi-cotransporter [Owenweeksia hongkongensis DSM 17368]